MPRTNCPSCGATIDIAKISGTDDSVPLEVHTDSAFDAPRFRIVGLDPLTVEAVAQRAPGDYRPDHRFDCPGHDNGLGRR